MENPAVFNIEVMLGLDQAKNHTAAEIRLTELSKIGELDASRRASGLIQQVRESDARLEAGLTIVKRSMKHPPK